MEPFEKLMTLLTYIFLGLFQGVTEPIPISSSGHLVLLREFLHINIPGLSFEIFVHFGSLIAILIVYRKEIVRLFQNSFQYVLTKNNRAKDDFYFVCLLIVATIPAALIGLLFEDTVSKLMKHTVLIGVTLLITGVFLWLIRHLRGHKNDQDLSLRHAIIIGIAQAVAIFPGISRSGATVIAAMFLGLKREVALRFSFLLYIPISLGATALSITDLVKDPFIQSLFIPSVLAFIAAIIATLFSLRLFINIMLKGNLKYFAYYCFTVGTLVVIYFI